MRGLHTLIHQLILSRQEQRIALRLLPALKVIVNAVSWAPRGVWPGLMLERARKGRLHRRDIETAHGGARDAILPGVERGVEQALLRHVDHALDLVIVEGIVAGNGAVQPGLEKGRPVVL